MKKGVETKVFSGAAAGVYKHSAKGDEKLIVHHGKTGNVPGAIPVNDNTLFDIASLTKPLCTVLLLLHLMDNKKLSWDSPIETLFGTKTPFFLKKITIRELMSHSSGLKSYEPYYMDFQPVQTPENKEKLLDRIFKEKPVYPMGEKCLYSDIGYMLLGEIIERMTGQGLNDVFASTITKPLGLQKQILFKTVKTPTSNSNRNIAATQFCPWRKRILQGEVDDEHSWLMNGVAGHAGLFGTINGVLDMTKHILNQWQGREEHPSYSNTLLQQALTRAYKNQTWCMGFDTPSLSGSSGGRYLSRKSVGHLGFTGTSFWIDPEKDMTVVLLTNRVHPDRRNEQIKKFRPLLHDTLFNAMENK
ncbi:MAG: beta-lactamase family protein [Desulfobulbaceae bacterium]|nr:beta-lactamase family protein [Desulfobulbaceae bacterium]